MRRRRLVHSRRQRYTVTLESGERKVILAYNGADATAWFIGRGYRVEKVERGDYHHAEASSPTGWRLNQGNLREAIAFLGIELPVRIKQTGHKGGRYGAHGFQPLRGKFMKNPALDTASGGMYHNITIKNWLSPEKAGETLWHELTHAKQAEEASASATTMRAKFNAWRTCESRGNGVTYMRKPVEVEAREYEKFNDELPLAR